MEINQTVFVKLMVGVFAVLVVGFVARGLATVAVGSDTADIVAAPIFVLALFMAAAATVLAVLIKLGVVTTVEDAESASDA